MVADVIDEVSEDMRHERWVKFWQQVGVYTVTASVAIVSVTAGAVLWRNYQKSQRLEVAGQYLEASVKAEQNSFEEAAEKFAALRTGKAKGIAALGQLRAAQALDDAGKPAEAKEAYMAVVNDSSADVALRSMARMYAAQSMVETGAGFDDVQAVLKPLADDEGNVFAAHAKEQLAYAALQAKDVGTATALLGELVATEGIPTGMKMRVQNQLAAMPAYASSVDAKTE